MVRQSSRFLEELDPDAGLGRGVTGAAQSESCLKIAPFCINALDVKLGNTRPASCVGFQIRSAYAFPTQLPRFSARYRAATR